MGGPRNCCTESSKSDKKRQIPYDITYMWNLKIDTNESSKISWSWVGRLKIVKMSYLPQMPTASALS